MASSAHRLLNDITGEEYDDYEDYSEEDEYYSDDSWSKEQNTLMDEQCREEKSKNRGNTVSSNQNTNRKNEKGNGKGKSEPEKMLCDVCQVMINCRDESTHVQSKKHRGLVVERKIKGNQIQRDVVNEAKQKEWDSLLNEVYTKTNFFELVFQYIPLGHYGRLRLVCKTWNEYFWNHANLEKQYFIRFGYYPTYTSKELTQFRLLNLFIKHRVTKESLTKIIERMKDNQVKNMCIFKIDAASLCNVLKDLPMFYKLLGNWNINKLTISFVNLNCNDVIVEIYKNILSAVASNKNLTNFACFIQRNHNVNFNILQVLSKTTSITELNIHPYWFDYVEKTFSKSDKDAKRRKYEYTFNNSSVTNLQIINKKGDTGFTRLKWILRWLIGNTTLQSITISKLSDFKATNKEAVGGLITELLKSKNIKYLDFSNNGKFGGLDLSVLEDNTTLESLNLNYCDLSQLKSWKLSRNQHLHHLYLQKTKKLKIHRSLIQCLPSKLHTLDLTAIALSYPGIPEGVFSGVNLPSLIELRIGDNRIQSNSIVCEILIAFPGLRILKIFRSTHFNAMDIDEISLLESFSIHNSLQECDSEYYNSQNRAKHKDFGSFFCTQLSKILTRNNSKIGRRTKAAR